MNKAWLGVFAVFAIACSSSSSTPATTTDSGSGGDSVATDSGTHDVVVVDSPKDTAKTDAPPGDAPATGENTVGNKCTGASDVSCDPLGTGDNLCEAALYPTPVCLGKSCDPGTGTSVVSCDNADGVDRGVCYPQSSGGGVCFPACNFDASGSAPTGCQGKDACSPFGWTTTAPISGVGICYGGCFADADCGTGYKCQTENGTCESTLTTYAKHPGDACTFKTGASATQDCYCFAAAATNNGYCSRFCEVGDTAHACPTGLACTAVLPVTASGSPLFTMTPTGMSGSCLKTCTADTDCKDSTGASISSTCQTTSDGKFCLPFTLGT